MNKTPKETAENILGLLQKYQNIPLYYHIRDIAKDAAATIVYGASDDLIEFEGLTNGEFGAWEKARFFTFEDGTKIRIEYMLEGKRSGIWDIKVTKIGTAEQYLFRCEGPDADFYSDLFFIVSRKKGVQDE